MTTEQPNSLPWPPEGLEPLRGQMDRLARNFWWGATLTALLTTSALERGLVGAEFIGYDASLLLGVAVLGSMLWLMWALDLVRGVSIMCWRGVRSGFGWMTLLEVGADHLGNTGDLIASRGRAAALDATQRRGLRAARLTATFSTLLSALVTLLVFIGGVRFGSVDGNGVTLILSIVAVALIGAVVRFTMRAWERSQFPRDRWLTRMRPEAELRERAAAWTAVFERHSDPAGFGRGPVSGAIVAHAWHAVVLVLGFLAFVVTMFVIVASISGDALIRIATPELQSVERRYDVVRALRRWAVPTDTAITPLEAGIAFATMDHRHNVETGDYALRDKVPLPTPPWADSAPPGLGVFTRGAISGTEQWIDSVTRRLTPVELAWMKRVAEYPGWEQMRTVVRGQHVDFTGGRFELPFPETADVFAMPIPPVSLYRDYGRANAYRVRYYLETGRGDSAVLAARELLTLGLRLTEDGRWVIESLIGMILANQGRNQLERAYAVLRDPQRDTLLRVTRDAAQRAAERRRSRADLDGMSSGPRIVAHLEGLARDTTRLRSIRWEATSLLSFSTCTEARSLLRGPSPVQRARFDAFVATETRWASDTAMVELMRDRPLRTGQARADGRVVYRVVDAVGALLGTPYLSSCVRFAGGLGL